MTKVLFVCTGNIFRSVTAEYALRAATRELPTISISSAGTRNSPQAKIRADVAAYLGTKSLDVSKHQRRTLTQDMLSQATSVISMSTDHQSFLREKFSTESLLFTEACGGEATPLLDIDELFAPEDHHSEAAQKHVFGVIDQIIRLTPDLLKNLV